jgi:hypothetical protein
MVALLGSTPRPVLPAITWAAFRLLGRESMSRQETAELLLPAALRADGGQAESAMVALDVLIDLGLVVEREKGVFIDPKLAESDFNDEQWFRRELRRRVLASQRNRELLESDEGTRELAKALAWFLAQPADNPPTSYNPRSRTETNSVTQLMNEQFGSDEGARSILQNSYRWSPFVRWAKYLGFLSFLPIKEGGPCPDPSEAIRDALAEQADKLVGEIELPRLVTALAKALPVLDGGSYRKLVEQSMDNVPVSAGDGETLSASLSFALLRLKDQGVIDLRRASDSPATRILSVRQGHRLPYSHAELLRPMGAAA